MITHITVEDTAKLISWVSNMNKTEALIYISEAADRGEIQAATALSTFQIENQALRNAANGFKAENEKLRAELEQAKRERDAAIKDLNEFLSMDELCPIQCEWCKWNGTYCDGKTPEWRGIQKED